MVICNKYNFVFLRIPKNASTSLATWFIQNCCDENDRYTGIGDSRIKQRNISDELVKRNKKHYHHIHLTLQELVDQNVISREEALTKEIITVIRNPLHRQLSLFFFKNKNHDKTPEEFRNQFKNGYHFDDENNKILQTDYCKLDGKPAPKVIYWNYDDIENCLKKFIENKKIQENFPLESFKTNYRTYNNEMINKYYDKKTKEAVKDYYKNDFDYLKYLDFYNKSSIGLTYNGKNK